MTSIMNTTANETFIAQYNALSADKHTDGILDLETHKEELLVWHNENNYVPIEPELIENIIIFMGGLHTFFNEYRNIVNKYKSNAWQALDDDARLKRFYADNESDLMVFFDDLASDYYKDSVADCLQKLLADHDITVTQSQIKSGLIDPDSQYRVLIARMIVKQAIYAVANSYSFHLQI